MRNWMLALTLFAGLSVTSMAEAAGPAQYWIIAPESTASPILTPRPKTRYSYGWFGVSQPYRTAGYHHGYQNTYVDWTFR
ncbi:hypothetical protein ACYFX5_21015 [Bremerella sp. T1]|uniref:hypothetical protein n=1 Tax=Bremerella sp. TYQ1 TaxID=3119568 RepID=UPI001CCAE162|nr:hypothetical protein [Bremerella volcania]UBM35525.1 hypothetical protein LA756_22955 [Bremerella volcania]